MNQPYARVNQPYATLTLASALREMFGVQLYKNNARALLSRILSILNLDWLQHARSVRGVYELSLYSTVKGEWNVPNKFVFQAVECKCKYFMYNKRLHNLVGCCLDSRHILVPCILDQCVKLDLYPNCWITKLLTAPTNCYLI